MSAPSHSVTARMDPRRTCHAVISSSGNTSARLTISCPTACAAHDGVSFEYTAGTKTPAALASAIKTLADHDRRTQTRETLTIDGDSEPLHSDHDRSERRIRPFSRIVLFIDPPARRAPHAREEARNLPIASLSDVSPANVRFGPIVRPAAARRLTLMTD